MPLILYIYENNNKYVQVAQLPMPGMPNARTYYPSLKYKKYRILPIKYFKHYKSTEYMKRTTLSINMIGKEKQKTWQKNTLFKSKMLKGLCSC